MKTLLYLLSQADNRSAVGGKAFALGKMIQAGFRIPDGFVVAAPAFQHMTPALRTGILQHFDQLGADFVAVRSSALNEDGSDAAWAGQLDTFLNCTGDNLLGYLQKCWDSAESARARAYAAQKLLTGTKVAVIVQEMIPSDISGVAFSAHPVTNDTTQVVIEAGLGLGEAIVSGQITPDTYIVDKHSGRQIQVHLASQPKKLVRSASGKTIWQACGVSANRQKLSGRQISELSKLTATLETFFGYAVDVEWAISGDTLYVLQCRPVTTLTS